jgi:hypothetical protein
VNIKSIWSKTKEIYKKVEEKAVLADSYLEKFERWTTNGMSWDEVAETLHGVRELKKGNK